VFRFEPPSPPKIALFSSTTSPSENFSYQRLLKVDNQFSTPPSIGFVCRASLVGFPQARVQLYSYALTLGHLWSKPHYRARSLADDMRPEFSRFMFPWKIIE